MSQNLTGGCQCGKIRYKVTSSPLTCYCCHCTECQAQSASAFGVSVRVDNQAIKISGNPSSYWRDNGKSTEVECLFCPDCGTRLIHRRNASAASASIKGGSLDAGCKVTPVGHIWTGSKQEWMIFPKDHLVCEGQPDDGYDALIERFRES